MGFYDVNDSVSYIYGLFDHAGRCLYAGQTLEPMTRTWRHKQTRQFHSARTLRKTTVRHASRIEAQIIAAYRKQGQCQLNRQLVSPPVTGIANNGTQHYLPSHNLAFRSKAQLARFLGYNSAAALSHDVSAPDAYKSSGFDSQALSGLLSGHEGT